MEKNSPIVLSLSNPINTLGSVTNINRHDEKYDNVALNRLKAQIIREFKNGLNLKSAQNDLSRNEHIIVLYKNEIDSLKVKSIS